MTMLDLWSESAKKSLSSLLTYVQFVLAVIPAMQTTLTMRPLSTAFDLASRCFSMLVSDATFRSDNSPSSSGKVRKRMHSF